MRLLYLLPLLCLLIGTVAPLPTAAQDLSLDVQERVLDNGVTVLVWERPAAGRIGARTFYRVDVGAERPGTVGLTHMLEHYLFFGSPLVGTDDWETERPIAEAVERLQREVTDERNRLADCLRQREVTAEVEANCSHARLATAWRTASGSARLRRRSRPTAATPGSTRSRPCTSNGPRSKMR